MNKVRIFQAIFGSLLTGAATSFLVYASGHSIAFSMGWGLLIAFITFAFCSV